MKQVIVLFCLGYLFGCALAQNKPSGRVVSGTAVSADVYSFLLQMHYLGEFFCGASIISYKHALTAAHCLFHTRPHPFFMKLIGGSSELNSGIQFSVEGYVIHPEYVSAEDQSPNNDAAIVTINGSFGDYPVFSAISLPTKDLTYAPDNASWCFMAGWGKTNVNSPGASNTLQLVWTQVISQYVCQKKWTRDVAITPQMVCVNLPNTAACRGDSGGPLVCNAELVGINSFGDRYCTGSPPSVFAKVSSTSIRSFIKQHTGL
ncbi:trypsin 3A1-like [Anopheles ziemanni]|uniref:trypsin 3A1-like n=1 Tax=Anopheles coustani TaxID=139045 RepID=UPI00265953D7|nr:trypsin 3A1-like [Anopheles coustani]XP_058170563.1 trypsin 3A1-like [Anopheles ziemanni]